MGLIAGLKRNEIDRMTPGDVMDLYAYRQAHDIMTHGGIQSR